MSMQIVLISVLVVGGAGLIIGLLLGVAGKKFAVEVDEREERVREVLPGNNCGGCGRKRRGSGHCLSGGRRGMCQSHRRDHGTGSRRYCPDDRVCKMRW